MAKVFNITVEQKRELISLRIEKHYSIMKLVQHARQIMGVDIKSEQTMKKYLDDWNDDIGAELLGKVEEKKHELGMDRLSRISDWSLFRSEVRGRLLEKLRDGKDLRFGELADMLLRADDKLASLLGVKEEETIKHELTVDFAPLFDRIRAAKQVDVVQTAEVEDVETESAPA